MTGGTVRWSALTAMAAIIGALAGAVMRTEAYIDRRFDRHSQTPHPVTDDRHRSLESEVHELRGDIRVLRADLASMRSYLETKLGE